MSQCCPKRWRRIPFLSVVRTAASPHYGIIPPVLHHDANHARSTNMRRLTTGIRSEKCVVRRFRRCAYVYLHKPSYTVYPTTHLSYMV